MNELYSIRESVGVVWLTTPNSKVNILDFEALDKIRNNIESVGNNPAIRSLVMISTKPRNFIAGADVNILSTFKCLEDVIKMSREAQEMALLSETFPKPVIAAINGSCVGGGVEAILGSHYNIAVNNRHTTFMLPEVMIGLLPGAGGTQRLPRKVPLLDALPMMLMGKEISAKRAYQIGLIDQLVEPIDPKDDDKDETKLRAKLLKVAIDVANGIVDGTFHVKRKHNSRLRRFQKYILELSFVRNMILDHVKAKIEKLSFGLYPAPLEIVEVLRLTLGIKDVKKGFAIESEGFGKLAMTKEHKALLGLFFGQTYCKKSHLGEPDRQVKNLVILGATWMGAGIAYTSLLKDFHVTIKETDKSNLATGIQQIKKGFGRKKIYGSEALSYFTQLKKTLHYDDITQADLIVESVSENVSIKQKLLRDCERVMPPHCVYGINTWITPVSHIAKSSNRKDMIIGMNYMAPVEKMKIVEIIRTEESSTNAVATAIDVALRQSKMVLVVRDKPGFFITRVLTATILETIRVLQESSLDAETIDILTKKVGFVAGILTVADGMGLDVVARNAKELQFAFGDRFTGGSIDLLKELVANGMCGKKSEKGLFLYSSKNKSKTINPVAQEILKKYKLAVKHSATVEEIQYRIILRFANEAIFCLQEGVITSPLEGDFGSVVGLGFPPILGGPFRWADMQGATTIVERMQALENTYGSSFTPCDLLISQSRESDRKFHQYGTFVI